ncbi:lysozyme C [Terrapene carolina triunguis]|uniref:lysozyme C n=1 Tax=Terrapene triunguis TaxID=2587831 RepID=UPI000E7743E1|nr:lysozyme C [Terrapene carolina triunguis]
MKVLPILGLFLLPVAAHGKIYERCELARAIKRLRLDGYWGYSLGHSAGGAMMARLQEPRTHVESSVVSSRYIYYCISFLALLTADITASVNYAKRIVRASNGMSAWVAWKKYCGG